MYYDKEFDEVTECRPSFEQLSLECIITEANKNIAVLKALENIVGERMTGLNALHLSLKKASVSYELLENVEGSLKVALDSLFLCSEQVNRIY